MFIDLDNCGQSGSLLSPSDSEFPKRPSSVVVRDPIKNSVWLSVKPCRFRGINHWVGRTALSRLTLVVGASIQQLRTPAVSLFAANEQPEQ